MENYLAVFVPVAETGSTTTTVEPRALLVVRLWAFSSTWKPAHVTHGHAPTFLTHEVHRKRPFESFFAHQLLMTRGHVLGVEPSVVGDGDVKDVTRAALKSGLHLRDDLGVSWEHGF